MNVYVASRVEAGSGHPSLLGHVLSWVWNWFIKYPGLIRIPHWITCINNSVWSLSNNELSVLGSDDGSVFRDIFGKIDCTIRVLLLIT